MAARAIAKNGSTGQKEPPSSGGRWSPAHIYQEIVGYSRPSDKGNLVFFFFFCCAIILNS
jgi:hypothetical protein